MCAPNLTEKSIQSVKLRKWFGVCVCVCGLRENVENVTQKGAQPMDVLSGTT